MKGWILAVVAALAFLAAPVNAQVQSSRAGTLIAGSAVTGAGPVAGTAFIRPSGWRQCVFQYQITAGTVTIELQQRIAAATGTSEWTTVAGSSSATNGFKFVLAQPLGQYRASYSNATGATFAVIYECDRTIVE